ncbi:MAG: stage V sporulation protein S [Chloroflexi bacterium]|nr:MAG: stage V sporulation protein S [Chloroflexota bacterium]
MNVIKVASRSRTALVAGAIAGVCRENGSAEVQAIGAGAVNQAIKAVIIAKGYLREEGKNIVFVPSFVGIEIEGQERTAVRITVEVQESKIHIEKDSDIQNSAGMAFNQTEKELDIAAPNP